MKTYTPSTHNAPFRVYFGGPDCRPRFLRDILDSHISVVPTGGEIFWATYYFRDEALADSLLKAKKRGVRVRLALEARPRTSHANRPVLEKLGASDYLATDCRAVEHFLPDSLLLWKKPRLHIKLYYFSHPAPHILTGTFNPSGNIPEDPDILAEIGDQDRGHNFLVEISEGRLVSPLRDHLIHLHSGLHGPWERMLPRNNMVHTAGDSCIYLFPRLQRDIIHRKLVTLPLGSTLRMAVSHLNDRGIAKTLLKLSKMGVEIKIITHDTERRVPSWIETRLDGHIDFRRYRHPQGFPMHNKFILVDVEGTRETIFGSMNLTQASLHTNHELLMVSRNDFLYDNFRNRWDHMLEETERMPS